MRLDSRSFQVDFSNESGHTLVIKHVDGWVREDFSELALKMIQHNRVPRLLPFEAVEVDFSMSLHYSMTSWKMLSSLMKSRILTANDIYTLLLQIAAALEESAAYMLHPSHYVLDEDFIFVGSDFGSVALVYIPLKPPSESVSSQEQIAALTAKLIGAVDLWRDSGWQKLIRSVQREDFSLSTWKQELIQLLKEDTSASPSGIVFGDARGGTTDLTGLHTEVQPSGMHSSHAASPEGSAIRDLPANGAPTEIGERLSWRGDEGQPGGMQRGGVASDPGDGVPLSDASPGIFGHEDADEWEGGADPHPSVTSRSRTIAVSIGLLFIALAWRLYAGNPGAVTLAFAGGVTLVTVAGVALFASGWRPRLPQRKQGYSAGPSLSSGFRDIGDSLLSWNGMDASSPLPREGVSGNPMISWRGGTAPDAGSPPASAAGKAPGLHTDSMSAEEYYRQLGQHTTLLTSGRDDATVLLRVVEQDSAANTANPHLVVQKDGQTETVPIHGESFTIGRVPECSQYVSDAIGVSRTHLELIRTDAGYGAKDLGSRNGSMLNDEPMTPYKVYPLHEGDVLKIVQTEFVFRGGDR